MQHEGLARTEAFLAALPAGERRLLARLSTAVAALARVSGRKARAFEAATQAVAYARACGDGPTLAGALNLYATIASLVGDRVGVPPLEAPLEPQNVATLKTEIGEN